MLVRFKALHEKEKNKKKEEEKKKACVFVFGKLSVPAALYSVSPTLSVVN